MAGLCREGHIYIYILLLLWYVRRTVYSNYPFTRNNFEFCNVAINVFMACCKMESQSNASPRRVPESAGNRDDRLRRRREQERARRASETAEQREERLPWQTRRIRDRASRAAQNAVQRAAVTQQRRYRLSTESSEEREARLQHMRERLATETAEEREARLQHMRDGLDAETAEERAARLQRMSGYQRERLDAETAEERAARLQRMSGYQRERLAAETAEERAARLHHDREGHRAQQPQLPLFEQSSVRTKMQNFHAHIATLDVSRSIIVISI